MIVGMEVNPMLGDVNWDQVDWFQGKLLFFEIFKFLPKQTNFFNLFFRTPSSGTIEGSELKVKCTGNGDIVSVALDMGSDHCTVAFYINHKFAGKHTFLKQNIPGGKLWPIVACSSGAHVAEVLPKHFDKNSPPTLIKVPTMKA